MLRRKRNTTTQAAPRRSPVSSERTPVFSYYSGQRRAATAHPDGRTQMKSASVSSGRGENELARQNRNSLLGGHKFAWRHVPTYLAVLMFVCAFLYVLSLSSDPRVVVEQQPGIIQRDAAVYESEVRTLWNKSFRNRSKLTTDTVSTRKAILDQYRELGNVRIQLPLVGRRATIVLVPEVPVLQIQAQNGLFYVDATGKALIDTSYVKQVDTVPTVLDDSILTVDPGKPVLSQAQTTYIVELFSELAATNLKVDSVTLSNQSANQLDVRLTGQKYFIKFQMDSDSDVRQAVGAYLVVRKKFESEGQGPSEYIDVRIPEKVFYK